MATRRMITSAIWRDDWFGQLDFFDQALWIGLFSTCADDQGRLLDNPILIRADVFPYKDTPISEVERALQGFADVGRIARYDVDGKRLIQIINWWEHQQPQWAQPSQWLPPEGWHDRVRTRMGGKYIEENWSDKPSNPDSVQLGSSPEDTSRDDNLIGQTPDSVPDPIHVPDSVQEDGAASPPITHDPLFLPDADQQIDLLCPPGGRGIEDQLRDLERSGWRVRSDDYRLALAHYLKASGSLIPGDKKTRDMWIGGIKAHLATFRVADLAKLYPVAVTRLRAGGIDIGWPGTLTKTLFGISAKGNGHGRASSWLSAADLASVPPLPPLPPPSELETFWTRALAELRGSMTGAAYNQYLSGTQAVQRDNGRLVIAAPSAPVLDWLDQRGRKLIEPLLAGRGISQVEFVRAAQDALWEKGA
jgi:hypothetical protein